MPNMQNETLTSHVANEYQLAMPWSMLLPI